MTSLAIHLRDAALKIAAANHYLVGFDAETSRDLSFDDLSDAKQLLIDLENSDTSSRRQHRYVLAFQVLNGLCYRLHKVHL